MDIALSSLMGLYFFAYLCFSLLTKVAADPFGTLPLSVATALGAWAAYLLGAGEWRRLRWLAITHHSPYTLRTYLLDVGLCALGSAAILLASTVAYGLRGVSIVLPLTLMKAGTILLAPAHDAAEGVAIPPRAKWVVGLALGGVLAGVAGRLDARDPAWSAILCAAIYVSGYALKLRAVGKYRGSWDFFVAETTLTLVVSLVGAVALCSWFLPHGSVLSWLPHPLLSACVGLASQCCGVGGGLILIRGGARATHSRLVPLSRCSSLLAGLTASLLLGLFAAHPALALPPAEAVGALFLLAALWIGR